MKHNPFLRGQSYLCLVLLVILSACASGGQNLQPTSTTLLAPTTTAVLTSAPTAPAALTSVPLPTETQASAAPAASMPSPTAQAAALTGPTPEVSVLFDGQRAMKDVEYQMALGPRTPDSPAHTQVITWMQKELEASGWKVEIQEDTRMGHPIRNVIAKRGTTGPWTLIGAHFDSRMKADQDPDLAKRSQPVPAANDGASGVAVLLELARVLPKDLNQQVWLTFFDAEDQGELPNWDWLLGSRVVADSLTSHPDAAIIIDMIGDANLNIYEERNSNPDLTKEIWDTAARLGYGQSFIAQPKYSMLDDHTPFLEKGIRAVDIIDFDYPYWHTTADTADKVSVKSMQTVGDTLLHWLIQVNPK